jgi:CBS domain-containing protein
MDSLWFPVRQLLTTATVSELCSGRPVSVIPEETTLQQALHIFADQNILSAPVVSGDQVKGILDVQDVVVCAYNLDTVCKLDSSVLQKKAGEIMHARGHDLPVAVEAKHPLLTLFQLFASGHHRAIVFADKNDKRMSGYVSQTDAVRYLADHVGELGLLRDQPLSSYCTKSPLTVDAMTPTLTVVQMMREAQVNAVAVINSEEQTFLAPFSASSLRAVTDIHDLQLPVRHFLAKYKNAQSDAVKLTKVHSIQEAISLMAKQRLHRVWITQNEHDDRPPVGVFTLTDVMSMVLKNVEPGMVRSL